MAETRKFVYILMVAASTFHLVSCDFIRGRETLPEYTRDTGITADVKGKLYGDEHLKMFEISVETLQGVVQLGGFVDSQSQKRRAEQLARQVEGVRSVKNSLVVRSL